MRIIRLWFTHLDRAEYTIHWSDRRHCLDDYYDETLYYTREAAHAALNARAEEFRETWKQYGEEIEHPCEVGYMASILVPIKDGITLPDDADTLFSPFDGVDENDEPLYIADGHPTDIVPEHEFPQIGPFYTVYEDGMILHGSGTEGEITERNSYISRWKEAGWNGKIEEVIR